MKGKLNPGRFTIQFDVLDPQQQQAIALLNKQGRKKAAYLTKAILVCYSKKEAPIPAASLSREEIEEAVISALQKSGVSRISFDNRRKCEQSSHNSGRLIQNTADEKDAEQIPENMYSTVVDTLNLFRT